MSEANNETDAAAVAAATIATGATGIPGVATGLGGVADFKRLIKEASREARKSRIPIFIAALAALLAMVSMADGGADKLALASHIEASNQWAYFQAKNIRKTDSEIAAATFAAMGKPDLAAKWQSKADRYSAEKGDIMKTAKAKEVQREVAISQGNYFTVAISMLQIAIVLASASLILGGGYLFGGSVLLTLIAVFYTVNGYGLFYEFPTEPVAVFYWATEAVGSTFNW